MLARIDTSIVVALVGAGASLVVAGFAQVSSRRTSERLARIEEERDERRARRDYEYEARKRLYDECEPLLFLALELAETARSRVLGLARTARNGDLCPDGSGWLDTPGYYFTSTAYLLLAPLTTFRMLQRSVTSVDLGLDPRLRSQYELLKLIFQSFNADFDLARTDVPRALPYEPDKTDPDVAERADRLASAPQRFARQGIYRGTLDVVVEALIVDLDGDRRARCITYGEFLREWDRRGSELHGVRGTILDLLGGFHPARKPVLWRVLVAQYLLYSVLLRDEPLAAPSAPLSEAQIAPFDWRRTPAEASDEEIAEPVRAAEAYLAAKLA